MNWYHWFGCTTLALFRLIPLLSQPAEVIVVAKTGQAFQGSTFLNFGAISASDDGLLFSAHLGDKTSTVLVEYRGEKISSFLDGAADIGDSNFELQALDSNRSRDAVFVGRDPAGADILYRHRRGELIELCREGDSFEETRLADIRGVSINQAGDVAFTASTTGANGPLTLFRARNGRIEILAGSGYLLGDEVVGAPTQILLADSGEVFFINGRKIGPLGMVSLSGIVGISPRAAPWVLNPETLPMKAGQHFENHRLGLGLRAFTFTSDGVLWLVADTTRITDGKIDRNQELFSTTPWGSGGVAAIPLPEDGIYDLKAADESLLLLTGRERPDHSMQRSLYRLFPDGRIKRLLSEGDPSPAGPRYRRIRDFSVSREFVYVSATIEGRSHDEFIIVAIVEGKIPTV